MPKRARTRAQVCPASPATGAPMPTATEDARTRRMRELESEASEEDESDAFYREVCEVLRVYGANVEGAASAIVRSDASRRWCVRAARRRSVAP